MALGCGEKTLLSLGHGETHAESYRSLAYGVGFSEVEGEGFQNKSIEEMQDEELDKAMIKASDIHGDPPCDGGEKYVAP